MTQNEDSYFSIIRYILIFSIGGVMIIGGITLLLRELEIWSVLLGLIAISTGGGIIIGDIGYEYLHRNDKEVPNKKEVK